MPEGSGGAAACPGAPENAFGATGGGFRAPGAACRVPQEAFFAHTNICSVPQEGVSGTEYHSCTRKACFLHRVPQKTHSVPQEAVLRTACIFRTTGGSLRYRMCRMPQTQRSHILRCRLPRHKHPHYSHPPHGSRLGQETTALRENLCNFLKKLRELSRSFFIFVPNKHRNTQCKLFTTNTNNSWNLPR